MAKVGKEPINTNPFDGLGASLAELTEEPAAPAPAPAPAPQPNPRRSAPAAVVEQKAPQVAEPVREPAPAPVAPRRSQPAPETRTRAVGGARTGDRASALTVTLKYKTSREESQRAKQAVLKLSAELGVDIDTSKVSRALWDVFLQHLEDIIRNVPTDETWIRPSNDDAVGLAELDARIAALINDGFMVASRRPQNRV